MVLSGEQPAWDYPSGRPSELSRLVAPLYSFKERQESLRRLVTSLAIPDLIYMPEDNVLGMVDGYVRLDRLQTCNRAHMKPMNLRLTEDALWMVQCFFQYKLTGELDAFWVDVREQLMRTAGL